MPFIQRGRPLQTNLVYSDQYYVNPAWIVSLSPTKVSNNLPVWNAGRILGMPVMSGGLVLGGAVSWTYTSSGLVMTSGVSGGGGSGVSFTAASGIVLQDSILKMGGIGQLNLLNFEENPASYAHTGISIRDSLNGFVNLENVLIGTSFGINSDSFYNVGIGRLSLYNGSGSRNIALGMNSLYFSASDDCIALGNESASNSLGYFYNNISVGQYSLSSSTAAGSCVGIGDSALNSVNNVSHTLALGYFAGAYGSNIYNSIYIGDSAGSYSSGSGNTFIGPSAGTNASGNNNIEILSLGGTSTIGNNSNKININNILYGDIVNKQIALGNVTAPNYAPLAALEIIPPPHNRPKNFGPNNLYAFSPAMPTVNQFLKLVRLV